MAVDSIDITLPSYLQGEYKTFAIDETTTLHRTWCVQAETLAEAKNKFKYSFGRRHLDCTLHSSQEVDTLIEDVYEI